MPHDECNKEKEWGSYEDFRLRAEKHIDEANREGGHRDRLAKLEHFRDTVLGCARYAISAVVILSIVCGVAGGLLSQSAPSLGNALADIIGR